MEEVTLNLPRLYGDHCVKAVIEALSQLNGIQEMEVSSARRQASIVYDPKSVSLREIEVCLKAAGYPPSTPTH